MSKEIEDKIADLITSYITDGFNRSLGALETAGAVNTKEMRKEYKGIGSKYYDLVTEQMEYTVNFARPAIREIIKELGLETKRDNMSEQASPSPSGAD